MPAVSGEWESAMRAKQLIDGASFGQDALRAARVKLAKAILSIASDDSRDVEVLKKAALERMALDYRESGDR